MFDEDLLAMLRCPATGQRLQLADTELVASVNAAIHQGQARDRAEQVVVGPIEQGLLAADRGFLYPIRGGIPTLIADEAIDLNPLPGVKAPSADA